MVLVVKNSSANAGDVRDAGSILEFERSPGEGSHSSVLDWRIPWTEEPGGLRSIGSHRVRHNRSDLACTGRQQGGGGPLSATSVCGSEGRWVREEVLSFLYCHSVKKQLQRQQKSSSVFRGLVTIPVCVEGQGQQQWLWLPGLWLLWCMLESDARRGGFSISLPFWGLQRRKLSLGSHVLGGIPGGHAGACPPDLPAVLYTRIPSYTKRKWSCSVMSDSLRPHGLEPARLLYPWNFLGKGTGVDCHFLLQGIFPTQGSNPGLPNFRQTLYRLSH